MFVYFALIVLGSTSIILCVGVIKIDDGLIKINTWPNQSFELHVFISYTSTISAFKSCRRIY